MIKFFKETHPGGLHPQVIARIFKVHIRTVFRLFKYGEIKTVGKSGLGDKKQILQILIELHRTRSLTETKKELRVTNGTLLAWRKNDVLKTITCLGKTRFYRASIRAIIETNDYQPGNKKVLFDKTDRNTLLPILNDLYRDYAPEVDRVAKEKATKEMSSAVASFEREDGAIRKQTALTLQMKNKS